MIKLAAMAVGRSTSQSGRWAMTRSSVSGRQLVLMPQYGGERGVVGEEELGEGGGERFGRVSC